MWMMGCSDGGGTDSFTGRKLRTLMPRPSVPPPATLNPPCLGHLHGADLLSFNHHLAAMTEQNKRELNGQQVVVSSRWNPTPEQLQTLEELYRRGTRTPSADQIQHITAQLRRYGKIEGKNVFYWFQNHKARERQKRRRQLESSSSSHDDLPPVAPSQSLDKLPGVNGTGLEVEGTKNWPYHPKNCSILPEKSVSIRREPKATIQGCRSDRWVQFDPQIKTLEQEEETERNATWRMMQQSFVNTSSSSSSPTTTPTPTNLITSAVAATDTAATAMIPTSSMITTKKLHRKPIHDHYNLDYVFSTTQTLHTTATNNNSYQIIDDGGVKGLVGDASWIRVAESQTLELFPLRSSDEKEAAHEKEIGVDTLNSVSPHKFFEFLPLKN